jgi:hypothetical protein
LRWRSFELRERGKEIVKDLSAKASLFRSQVALLSQMETWTIGRLNGLIANKVEEDSGLDYKGTDALDGSDKRKSVKPDSPMKTPRVCSALLVFTAVLAGAGVRRKKMPHLPPRLIHLRPQTFHQPPVSRRLRLDPNPASRGKIPSA